MEKVRGAGGALDWLLAAAAAASPPLPLPKPLTRRRLRLHADEVTVLERQLTLAGLGGTTPEFEFAQVGQVWACLKG